MKQVKNKKTKVLVAMSGGVDSSVAAALLVREGYDITGAYMVNYQDSVASHAEASVKACWLPDYRDAVRVAAELGIPFLKLDFTKEYSQFVLDYMFNEYDAGRTPNPDVLCNRSIKFGVWLDKAREMGFEYLATGHYARVEGSREYGVESRKKILLPTIYSLLISKDENKDQTYFLHQLTQAQLQHVMFPIGDYTKPEVRRLAKKFKLPTAEKEESMGICFVGEVPMHEFLMQRIKPRKGKIVLSPNTVGAENFQPAIVGEHDGLPFYTIGQRSGLFLGCHPERSEGSKTTGRSDSLSANRRTQNDSKPLYVLDKRFDTNELVVGYEDDPLLYKKEIVVGGYDGVQNIEPLQAGGSVHWINGQPPVFPLQCEVRLRHRQPLQKATVRLQTTDYRLPSPRAVDRSPSAVVRFATPQRAVTPGQFAVFYKKGECLGGGVIL